MARISEEDVKKREDFVKTFVECAQKPSVFSDIFLNHNLFDYNKKYVDCLDRFIVYRSGRQVGKTMSTAVKAIHFAFFAPMLLNTVKRECTILIVAPTQNQASIMYDRIRELITGSDMLGDYIVRNTQTEMWLRWLDDKGTTKIVTRATGETGTGLRGYSPHVIIVDECSFIKEDILTALFPAGAATRARVWLTSTPFSMMGYFYNACTNSKTLNGEPVSSDGQWTQFHVKSTDNPMIANDPDYIKFLENQTRESYALEVLGEFLEIGNALIPQNLLQDAMTDGKPYGGVKYYVGVDVARSGMDETVFTVISKDENNIVFVVHQEKEGQSNIVDVAGRTQELAEKFHAEMIYVDETGLGAGLYDLLEERGVVVRGVVFSLKEKELIYKNLRLLFEQKRIKIGGRQELAKQLGMLTREYTETKLMKIKSDYKDDHADSLAIACQAVSSGDQWHVIKMSKELQETLFG